MIAHRGASGYAFENSPAAFREAAARGVDGVELDVHATADGGIVVHHDPELTGGQPLDALTLAEATAWLLPNGEPVPTLAAALNLIGDRDVWVEVKSLPVTYDAALLSALDSGPFPARYAVHSFDHRVTARLSRLRPRLRLGALLSSRVIDPVAVVRASCATTLWQEWTADRPGAGRRRARRRHPGHRVDGQRPGGRGQAGTDGRGRALRQLPGPAGGAGMSGFPTRVAVIGAGTMGAGIAQAAATAGWPTTLTDTRPEALQGRRGPDRAHAGRRRAAGQARRRRRGTRSWAGCGPPPASARPARAPTWWSRRCWKTSTSSATS